MKERLQQIIDHYGADAQFEQFRCEVAELNEALCRLAIHNQSINIDQVMSEIADVWIMSEQFCMIFGKTLAVRAEAIRKVDRQIRRIENE